MICPSCSESLIESVRHCVHCGIAITRRSVQMAKIINNFGWVARRSLGGFFAGALGWVLAIAVSRTIHFESASVTSLTQLLDFFPGKSVIPTAIGGCFIGTVGGMIERSTYKSFLGGLLGTVGGILGALSFPIFENIFKSNLYSYSFSMAGSWMIASAMIGLTSGLLEGTNRKIIAGTLGGVIGGILGGGIGSQIYGALLMEVGNTGQLSWTMGRVLEFISGGITGVNVWFFLGLAEKLYIFKRRQLLEGNQKVCDHCHAENILKAWYCAQCGSALQVAATRDQIKVTPFRGLERISNAFQFLSWLSTTAGVVLVIVVFLSFSMQNFLFALFGSLLIGLTIYIVSILFKSLSDIVKMAIQITEKISHDSRK